MSLSIQAVFVELAPLFTQKVENEELHPANVTFANLEMSLAYKIE